MFEATLIKKRVIQKKRFPIVDLRIFPIDIEFEIFVSSLFDAVIAICVCIVYY